MNCRPAQGAIPVHCDKEHSQVDNLGVLLDDDGHVEIHPLLLAESIARLNDIVRFAVNER